MNWSAKDREWLSPHYGDESVMVPSVVPRCLQATRQGRLLSDSGRTAGVPGIRISNPIRNIEMGSEAPSVVGRLNSTINL
jgi:hypothetical protein